MRCRRAFDQHALFHLAQHVERAAEFVGRRQGDCVAEPGQRAVGHFATVHVEIDMAVAVQQGEAQGERRAGHVAATHVQQPGDGVGGSNQRHVSAFRRDDLADAGALGVACLARELYRMRQHGRQRRRWPAMPHGVDGIGLHCDEGAAGTLAGAREAVVAVDGLQPGIESQAAALGQVLGDPGFRRFFRDLMGHEGRDIDLAADGEGVAAVDEDRCRRSAPHRDLRHRRPPSRDSRN